jgi:hypothetical protein
MCIIGTGRIFSGSNIIQWVSLYDKRVALRMAETVDFKVYIKVWPLNGFRTGHLDIEYAADGCILHPGNAVV